MSVGGWLIVDDKDEIRWLHLNGAVEFHVGDLEFTVQKEALGTWIERANEAYAALRADVTIETGADPRFPNIEIDRRFDY